MWRRVDLVDWTDVSEKLIASIFRVEKNPWAKNQREQVAADATHASSSLTDFSTLKMEAIRFSETSVQSTRCTRRHITEDGILHSHRRENFKSYNACYTR
jgi:hypothetical protein